jgi:hypothetical protein
MASAKLIVAYPQPKDAEVFDAVYEKETSPWRWPNWLQGAPPFYRIAEVHFPSMEALQGCAESACGKETLAHAVKISSGGPPVIMIAK